MNIAIKANPARAGDAKPRILASFATAIRHEEFRIAGLPKRVVTPLKETAMNINIADVIVHVDETLPPDQLKTLENHIHGIQGVVSACNRDDQPHLITVVYDPEEVNSHDILEKIEVKGFHAELVGL